MIFLISLLRDLLYRSSRLFCPYFGIRRLFCPYFGILAFDFSCSELYFTEVAGLFAPASAFSFLISSAQGSTLPK